MITCRSILKIIETTHCVSYVSGQFYRVTIDRFT